ncbi:nucleolar MIF4G domain-containing protein 1-like protein isoform X1 [Tanacetum coccineum]
MSDVVEEILSRLLVKDLLRCKSVCKSWYSLISSPSFVKSHCKFMCNKEDINTRRIAMIPPELCSYNIWRMEGSSNGLVCISYIGYKVRIIVTNPLTREFRELALPPDLPEDPAGCCAYARCLGIGYDSSIDDYKVVAAICTRFGRVLVHILSLKSNIWKLFGHINYRSREDTPGILFNGALHWFWFDATYPGYEKVLIVSFDLAKEEFIDIPQPDDTRYVWSNCSTLGIIEGRLCIFCKQGIGCFDKHNWSIWAMKSYNGKPSWELLPIASYMLKDSNQYRITPPPIYFCDDNLQLSRSEEYMSSPIFVQTLVSPYVNNNNGGPSHTKNNKSTVNTGRPRDAKNSESTVSNGRSSHAKNNKSNDSWKRIGICKEKRELEEEEKEEWNKHIQERACFVYEPEVDLRKIPIIIQFQKAKKKSNNKKTEKVHKNTRIPEETESLPKLDEFVDIESRKDDISADEDLRLERKLAKKLKLKNKKSDEEDDASGNTSKSHKKKKRTVSFRDDDETKKEKTKFEKYLELETRTDFASAKEDLDLERRLAKRLKVKKGKLGGDEDDLNMLLPGFSSGFDSLDEASDENIKKKVSKKKRKKNLEQKVDPEITSDDVAEELEPENETTSVADMDSENNIAQVPVTEKQVKYVPPHLRSKARNESEEFSQVRKRVRGLLNRLGESNVEGIAGEMSTIFQSISRSDDTQIISEEILTSCSSGPRGNEQYAAVFASLVSGLACLVGIDFGAKLLASLAKCFEDEYEKEDNLSLRNLTLLLSYLYIFGVCSSDLIYDFMMMLSSRLTEVDVSTILTVLNCSGMRLRSDDPATMKGFIVSIQNKVAELKASGDSQGNSRSKRMEFMLETIFDIKNNKKKAKEDTLQHTRIKKWLQKLRVESILVRGLKWSKLLDPDKKGQWWLSGDMLLSATDNINNVARKIDRESSEAQKMLQLAAGQRMNTDARRAIFCIIMSGEDYIDAFEKLLRLELQGKQRDHASPCGMLSARESIQQYFCVLLQSYAGHDKTTSSRYRNFISKLTYAMFQRDLFEAVFECADNVIWNIFKRIAGSEQYETLRTGIKFFIESYVLAGNKKFAGKYKIAKKAFKSVEEEDPFA